MCKIWSISPYLVRMQENTDQKNTEQEHFLLSGSCLFSQFLAKINTCYDTIMHAIHRNTELQICRYTSEAYSEPCQHLKWSFTQKQLKAFSNNLNLRCLSMFFSSCLQVFRRISFLKHIAKFIQMHLYGDLYTKFIQIMHLHASL